MATPVSVETPPKAHLRTGSEQERDFQEKISLMINLQNYEQQQLSRTNFTQQGGVAEKASSNASPSNLLTTPRSSQRFNLPPATPPSRIPGVGTGTLFFSKNLKFGNQTSPSSGYGAVSAQQQQPPPLPLPQQPQQQHDFYYGNPDYHYPYDDALSPSRRTKSKKSFCERICCLYRPIINHLDQEQLCRSFCYGAIDGTLTGSGIASAFCALGVLDISAKWETRLAVFAFSAATCCADSICMAIGHVWTSFTVSSIHSTERSKERKLLEKSKGDSKAKLIDMLLSRGVLKIDAMSLADTLEGYPDLFINALVGDSLCAGPEDNENPDSAHSSHSDGLGKWKFSSYGQFDEMDHDPESAHVNMIVKESRGEGVFMMIGFATFALIPSLLWLFLPLVVAEPNSSKAENGGTISLPSLIISITAVIMWCLGAWKSSFLDSNLIMFGIETVIVLLICVLSSYGIGLLLSNVLGGIAHPLSL